MTNRNAGYRQKSAVETAISAASVRARYSTGAMRSGFPKNGFAPTDDTFHVNTRNEDFEQGNRANPGDKGFLYADTPQATVFVGKKQWISDTWTYVAEFERGIDPAPGTQIPAQIDRRTVISSDGESRSKDNEKIAKRLEEGRLYETQKRDIYERILTRKLQWLSDYEAIYKLANKLNVAQELGRITPELKEDLLNRLAEEEPSALLASDLDLLADLEALPTGLGNSNTTRYYTAPVVDEEADGPANRYARKLFQLRSVEKFAGPDSAEALDALIETQEQSVSELREQRDSLTGEIEELTELIGKAREQLRNQDAGIPITLQSGQKILIKSDEDDEDEDVDEDADGDTDGDADGIVVVTPYDPSDPLPPPPPPLPPPEEEPRPNQWNPIWTLPATLGRRLSRPQWNELLNTRASGYKQDNPRPRQDLRGNEYDETEQMITDYIRNYFSYREAQTLARAIGQRIDSDRVQALRGISVPIVYREALTGALRHTFMSLQVSGPRLRLEELVEKANAKMAQIKELETSSYERYLEGFKKK